MRGLPFFKPTNKPQFAGLNFSDGSGGGGGSGSTFPYNIEVLTGVTVNNTDTTIKENVDPSKIVGFMGTVHYVYQEKDYYYPIESYVSSGDRCHVQIEDDTLTIKTIFGVSADYKILIFTEKE